MAVARADRASTTRGLPGTPLKASERTNWHASRLLCSKPLELSFLLDVEWTQAAICTVAERSLIKGVSATGYKPSSPPRNNENARTSAALH